MRVNWGKRMINSNTHGILRRGWNIRNTSENCHKEWSYACIWVSLGSRTRDWPRMFSLRLRTGNRLINLRNKRGRKILVRGQSKETKGGLGLILVEGMWAHSSYQKTFRKVLCSLRGKNLNKYWVELHARQSSNLSTNWPTYWLVGFCGWIYPSLSVSRGRPSRGIPGKKCLRMVCLVKELWKRKSASVTKLFAYELRSWEKAVVIFLMWRFSSISVLYATTECSLIFFNSYSWEKKIVNGERSGKLYTPICITSCNSRDKELKNKVTKLDAYDIALGGRRWINSV